MLPDICGRLADMIRSGTGFSGLPPRCFGNVVVKRELICSVAPLDPKLESDQKFWFETANGPAGGTDDQVRSLATSCSFRQRFRSGTLRECVPAPLLRLPNG
jgi:hypothetical protein